MGTLFSIKPMSILRPEIRLRFGWMWTTTPVGTDGGNIPEAKCFYHRIGLWENLQENPIFDGKNHGFL